MRNFKNKRKASVLSRIVHVLIEEDFPIEHLKALNTLVNLFNWSEETEKEVFDFIYKLEEKSYPF